jgi:glycosyltransferase involved in cell wall biosynthesis
MHSKQPRVTVVVPNYNYGHWIESCLDSIANDPYDSKSIVVVDDGSTDNSAQKIYNLITDPKPFSENEISGIVGTYKDYNFKIKLIAANVSRGPSAARNIGIKSCFNETDFFSFIDSDDMHISGKIKKTVKKMIEHQGYVGVVYCDYENLYVDKNRIHQQYKEPFCSERLLSECIIPPHSLVAKYAIEESGPDHAKRFEAQVVLGNKHYGHGTGSNKKEAEQEAAASAYAEIKAARDIENQLELEDPHSGD